MIEGNACYSDQICKALTQLDPQQRVEHGTVQRQAVSALTTRLYSFQYVDFLENLQVDALSYLLTGKVVASLSQ